MNCEGVIFMDPKKRTRCESYAFADIVNWGKSPDKFVVVVGNYIQQKKLIFKTTQGHLIDNLIHDYIQFIVRNQVASQ